MRHFSKATTWLAVLIAVSLVPATMLAGAVRLYNQGCVYDFKSFLRHGLLVHAPGRLTILEERADGIRFQVSGWPDHPYWILVNGVRQTPRVLIQDQELPLAAGR